MKYLLSIIYITLLFLTASCNSGGGSSTATSDPSITDPSITGFNFALQEGDYWEFAWDYYVSIVDPSGGTSSTRKGVFRITLGTPSVIGNITAFPMITTGNNRQDVPNAESFVTPRWTHIAINDNKVMVSSDGIEFKTIFDANTGDVIGYGFFQELASATLLEVTTGTISNDYINEPAYVVSDSIDEPRCVYYPDIGNICNEVGVNVVRKEFYQADIGPVGYYYDSSSDTATTGTIRIINIGLVASSRRGDVVNYDLETEPNNTPATASQITKTTYPVTMKGDLTSQADIDVSLPENYATTYRYYVNDRNEVEPNNYFVNAETINLNQSINGNASVSDIGENWASLSTKIEDWYEFTVTALMASQYGGTFPFDVNLDFFDAAGTADIDMYLFNSNGVVVASANGPNSASDGSDGYEYFRPDLAPGLYTIGVDVWSATDASAKNYTLSVTETSIAGSPDVSNMFWIVDFYEITIEASTDINVVASPGLGVFLTSADGMNVFGSTMLTASQTTLIASVISPGTYLIAIGVGAPVVGSDTYEFTISLSPLGSN